MKSYKTSRRLANGAIYVILSIMAILWVLPILWLVIISF